MLGLDQRYIAEIKGTPQSKGVQESRPLVVGGGVYLSTRYGKTKTLSIFSRWLEE